MEKFYKIQSNNLQSSPKFQAKQRKTREIKYYIAKRHTQTI